VESYKEYNKLEDQTDSKKPEIKKNGKEKYSTVIEEEEEDSGVFACSCNIF
jgi:hypothetical protein